MNNRELSVLPKGEWEKVKYLYCNSSKFDLEARTKNLMDIKKVLDGVGLEFWLHKGTALAAYREKDWIPWDDDVDLAVYEEHFLGHYERLYEIFLSQGFIVRGDKREHFSKLTLHRFREKTTVSALYLDPTYEDNKFRLRRGKRYPRHFYESEGRIDFKGQTFWVPAPIEDYLVYVYGENWRVPNKSVRRRDYSTKSIYR